MLRAVASRCTEYWSGVSFLRVLSPEVVDPCYGTLEFLN